MNKSVSIILTLGILAVIGIFTIGGGSTPTDNNVEIRDGIQYVKIDAKGGYLPRVSLAQAGIPTKLVMNTSSTFDCSSALVIKKINYQNILPQDGETEIDIGIGEPGEVVDGLCSMGMYNFEIRFD